MIGTRRPTGTSSLHGGDDRDSGAELTQHAAERAGVDLLDIT